MKKLKIAVFFGGCSPEYSVSLESATGVIMNMDREKYEPILVGITSSGEWYNYTGDIARIREDTWHLDTGNCVPAVLSPSRGEHRLILLKEGRAEYIDIDAAFPVLHGQNGEDGTLQGAIELAGIPLVGCGVLASALCMDKDRAHKIAGLAGVEVPRSCTINSIDDIEVVTGFGKSVGYPLFVKPVKAGSSYGVSRVTDERELQGAVENAFKYDNEIIVEEAIEGFEVGCAVMGTDKLTVGEVDEIELSGGFFDFTEKYTLKTSAIHVPARIDRETSDRIKKTARILYKALGCSGFARVDMFLTPDKRIVFNEINTIPGFTEHSRFPGMMKAAGISFGQILDTVIDGAVK